MSQRRRVEQRGQCALQMVELRWQDVVWRTDHKGSTPSSHKQGHLAETNVISIKNPMKVVIQRVLSGSVVVNKGKDTEYVSGSIEKGYVVLVGISREDVIEDMHYIAGKLLTARLFPDESGKEWVRNITEVNGEILLVSQFTLYGFLNGNKPDFHEAMKSEEAKPLFDKLVQYVKEKYNPDRVHTGAFGADMTVSIENDGPTTIIIDSRVSAYAKDAAGMAKIGGNKTWKKYNPDK
ncbi:D-tyrosyl-tRNA deacylase/ Hydroxymethylglutaryl-CoA synthase [Giardia duodenalis assemblage B]|uniref:D-aminoacyl-tRNA deacylase n=1 Tax=Giardia duodenalis assemblage B TaxID=1394984 RepID=A0A132NV86_GIAIN|nr:D-tyrosyl-tRNA deacylase/ Hydroxymethylglutaryl-CoA synthase [Giardia intestinalis assemblage B]